MQEFTEQIFTSTILPIKQLSVWKVGLFYGSTVYFQFGNKYYSDKKQERGEYCLIICCDDWSFYIDDKLLIDSTSISREFAEGTIQSHMIGAKLSNIVRSDSRYAVFFDNRAKFVLQFNQLEEEHDAIHIYHKNSILLSLTTRFSNH